MCMVQKIKIAMHAKMGVNGQCVQPLCLPAWEGDNCTVCVHVWVFCQWCTHALAVVNLEALWRPTGIYCNQWEPVVEACELCQFIYLWGNCRMEECGGQFWGHVAS